MCTAFGKKPHSYSRRYMLLTTVRGGRRHAVSRVANAGERPRPTRPNLTGTTTVAAMLVFRTGLSDATAGRAPYLWAGRALLRIGKDIGGRYAIAFPTETMGRCW
jgi:hypothetical protein